MNDQEMLDRLFEGVLDDDYPDHDDKLSEALTDLVDPMTEILAERVNNSGTLRQVGWLRNHFTEKEIIDHVEHRLS